jgi:hypothetical protein
VIDGVRHNSADVVIDEMSCLIDCSEAKGRRYRILERFRINGMRSGEQVCCSLSAYAAERLVMEMALARSW